ncbi:MAG: shikimate dehydrogenase [Rikenellaceae bacterium]
MRKFGLIGEHLPHSFSGKYFAEKFEREGITGCQYSLHELATIDDLTALLDSTPELEGFNVTIPYKQQVMKFLDGLSPEAEAIGAVNCVKREGGKLIGYNTDIIGLHNSMVDFFSKSDFKPTTALILGTGGAALAVEYIMRKMGVKYKVVSRSESTQEERITYDDVTPELIAETLLIVNATPLGTFPDVDSSPAIPYEAMTEQHHLFDLVYNPPMTKFMKLGAEYGANVCNGGAMLVGQAEASWEIWNDKVVGAAESIDKQE